MNYTPSPAPPPSDTDVATRFVPTAEQSAALAAIGDWYLDGTDRPFVLAGLAGTGKTAVLPMLAEVIGTQNIRFIAPTWKAASTLSGRLREAGLAARATSIHALIYTYVGVSHDEDCAAYTWEARNSGADCNMGCKSPNFVFTPGRESAKDLIVCDEASMVDGMMRADIEALGHPVLYVGDHGQLAPVQGKSIFAERDPNFALESIQRQVAGSPIIKLSRIVRARDPQWLSKARDLGFSTSAYDIKSGDHAGGGAVFLAFKNLEVDAINTKVRRVLGYGPDVVVGDRIITRDNDHARSVFNGQVGVVRAIRGEITVVEMDSGREFAGRLEMAPSDLSGTERTNGVMRACYAYACTVHRMQGSEAERIIVKLPRREAGSKWLYTAVTRAKSELFFR